MARAARRSKKRFGGALQPLSLLSVQTTAGRGALAQLVQAEVTRAFPRVLSDLGRLHAGFAGLELLRELCPEHEPDDSVFSTAVALLGALDAGQADAERLLLCFESRLLALCGFAPRLDRCGQCDKHAEPARAALFDPRLGHLVCRACGGASYRLAGAVRSTLMRAAGAEWIAAAADDWKQSDLADARSALRTFIEQRIGRPLKAASLLATAPEKS